MNRISPIVLGMSLALAGGCMAVAQDESATPPKIIQITREWLKPGKSFVGHEKASVAFVNMSARAKLQGHYVALDAMSGKLRTLYITRYPSFEAWETDNKMMEKSPAAMAEMDRAVAGLADFDDSVEFGIFAYDEELSYHPHPDLSHARYYQINTFHVRAGHNKEWHEAVKMYQAACDKAENGAHWGMYEITYGGESGTYIAMSHRDSMKEIDLINAGGKKFVEAMGGEDAMQKFDELIGQAVDSSRTELYAINPQQSYAEESWIKSDPDFWKPKKASAEAVAAKPAAPKPAPAAAKPGGR
jgi:hypothetical protein